MSNDTFQRIKGLLVNQGYKNEDIPTDNVKLAQLGTSFVHADEDFINDDNFDWYVPDGAGAFVNSSEENTSEEPTNPDPENPNPDNPNPDDPGQSEIEIKEESNAWAFVNDAESFNTSLENGGLSKYYEKYPDEDLEATNGSGNATFNDRIYVGSFDESNEVVEFKASWEETSQKITNVADPTEVYYMERIDDQGNQYDRFQGESWTLYTDIALTTEAGHVFNITRLEFDGFTHTYNAAVNAPGSTLPWVVVNFDGDKAHTVEFEYDGTEVESPWDHAINWGVVSTADIANNFDESKLKMYITK